MSGVLQRLATRVLPGPGAVRPRLGSRFEGFSGPAEPDAVEPESGQAAHAPGRAAAAVEPEPGPAARRADRPAAAPAAGLAAPVPGAPWTAPEILAAPAPLLPAPAPLLPAPADGGDGVAAANSPAARARSLMPSPVANAAANRLAAEPPAAPARQGAAAASAERSRHRPPEAPQRTPSRGWPRAANEESAATVRWPEAPLISPRPLGAAASHEALARPMAAPAPAPAAPDIQVSIGRIEIRADRNETRPPRLAPPRPSLMSLEDYLGKRRGRR